MRGMGAALLLAAVVGMASGCGGGDATAFTNTAPTGSVRVGTAGTGGFVPVGSTGINLMAPVGAVTQDGLVSARLFSSVDQVGAPFAGSDTFLTGLQFGTSISPLVQPLQLQVPLVRPIPVGTVVSVLQQVGTGFVPVALTSSGGTFVPFTIDRPGTFIFRRADL